LQLKQNSIPYRCFAIATPYPGTELYQQAEEKGFNVERQFPTVGQVSINMSTVSDEKLSSLRTIVFRRFYFNPVRCLRPFIRVPRKLVLIKNFIEVVGVALLRKELYG
jgi:hypothetical protein